MVLLRLVAFLALAGVAHAAPHAVTHAHASGRGGRRVAAGGRLSLAETGSDGDNATGPLTKYPDSLLFSRSGAFEGYILRRKNDPTAAMTDAGFADTAAKSKGWDEQDTIYTHTHTSLFGHAYLGGDKSFCHETPPELMVKGPNVKDHEEFLNQGDLAHPQGTSNVRFCYITLLSDSYMNLQGTRHRPALAVPNRESKFVDDGVSTAFRYGSADAYTTHNCFFFSSSAKPAFTDVQGWLLYPAPEAPFVTVTGKFRVGVNSRPIDEDQVFSYVFMHSPTGDMGNTLVMQSGNFTVFRPSSTEYNARINGGAYEIEPFLLQGFNGGWLALFIKLEYRRLGSASLEAHNLHLQRLADKSCLVTAAWGQDASACQPANWTTSGTVLMVHENSTEWGPMEAPLGHYTVALPDDGSSISQRIKGGKDGETMSLTWACASRKGYVEAPLSVYINNKEVWRKDCPSEAVFKYYTIEALLPDKDPVVSFASVEIGSRDKCDTLTSTHEWTLKGQDSGTGAWTTAGATEASFLKACMAGASLAEGCSGTKDVTYYKALGVCEANGGRLCSAQELNDGIAAGSGCDNDDKWVWSSTPCGKDRYLAHKQDPANGNAPRCQALSTAMNTNVVCCGDSAKAKDGAVMVSDVTMSLSPASDDLAGQVSICDDEIVFQYAEPKHPGAYAAAVAKHEAAEAAEAAKAVASPAGTSGKLSSYGKTLAAHYDMSTGTMDNQEPGTPAEALVNLGNNCNTTATGFTHMSVFGKQQTVYRFAKGSGLAIENIGKLISTQSDSMYSVELVVKLDSTECHVRLLNVNPGEDGGLYLCNGIVVPPENAAGGVLGGMEWHHIVITTKPPEGRKEGGETTIYHNGRLIKQSKISKAAWKGLKVTGAEMLLFNDCGYQCNCKSGEDSGGWLAWAKLHNIVIDQDMVESSYNEMMKGTGLLASYEFKEDDMDSIIDTSGLQIELVDQGAECKRSLASFEDNFIAGIPGKVLSIPSGGALKISGMGSDLDQANLYTIMFKIKLTASYLCDANLLWLSSTAGLRLCDGHIRTELSKTVSTGTQRLRTHVWHTVTVVADPEPLRSFEYLFDGCPRGGGSTGTSRGIQPTVEACKLECAKESACQYIEMNGCLDDPHHCANGTCFTFTGASSEIHNGRCDVTGEQRTYARVDAPAGVRVYVDGRFDHSIATSSLDLGISNHVTLFNAGDDDCDTVRDTGIEGRVARLLVWKRALTYGEIAQQVSKLGSESAFALPSTVFGNPLGAVNARAHPDVSALTVPSNAACESPFVSDDTPAAARASIYEVVGKGLCLNADGQHPPRCTRPDLTHQGCERACNQVPSCSGFNLHGSDCIIHVIDDNAPPGFSQCANPRNPNSVEKLDTSDSTGTCHRKLMDEGREYSLAFSTNGVCPVGRNTFAFAAPGAGYHLYPSHSIVGNDMADCRGGLLGCQKACNAQEDCVGFTMPKCGSHSPGGWPLFRPGSLRPIGTSAVDRTLHSIVVTASSEPRTGAEALRVAVEAGRSYTVQANMMKYISDGGHAKMSVTDTQGALGDTDCGDNEEKRVSVSFTARENMVNVALEFVLPRETQTIKIGSVLMYSDECSQKVSDMAAGKLKTQYTLDKAEALDETDLYLKTKVAPVVDSDARHGGPDNLVTPIPLIDSITASEEALQAGGATVVDSAGHCAAHSPKSCVDDTDVLGGLGEGSTIRMTVGDTHADWILPAPPPRAAADDVGCSSLTGRMQHEAAQACAAKGGRLCTAAELEADAAQGSGCSFDNTRVWSSTPCSCSEPCTSCSCDCFYTTAGKKGSLSTHPRQCSEPTTTADGRCCGTENDGDLDASAGCSYQEGINYDNAFEVRTIQQSTLDECCLACFADFGCNAWSLSSVGECVLKSSDHGSTSSATHVSGVPRRTARDGYSITPGFDYTGNSIGQCDESKSGNGADYRGCQDKTRSGHTCQRWLAMTPHEHNNHPDQKPDFGLEDNNYCRNPSSSNPSIWCYTTNPDVRWDNCDPIPVRPSTTSSLKKCTQMCSDTEGCVGAVWKSDDTTCELKSAMASSAAAATAFSAKRAGSRYFRILQTGPAAPNNKWKVNRVELFNDVTMDDRAGCGEATSSSHDGNSIATEAHWVCARDNRGMSQFDFIVGASSALNAAVSGDMSVYWQAAGAADEWIQFDFVKTVPFPTVKSVYMQAFTGSTPTSVRFLESDDGSNWRTVMDVPHLSSEYQGPLFGIAGGPGGVVEQTRSLPRGTGLAVSGLGHVSPSGGTSAYTVLLRYSLGDGDRVAPPAEVCLISTGDDGSGLWLENGGLVVRGGATKAPSVPYVPRARLRGWHGVAMSVDQANEWVSVTIDGEEAIAAHVAGVGGSLQLSNTSVVRVFNSLALDADNRTVCDATSAKDMPTSVTRLLMYDRVMGPRETANIIGSMEPPCSSPALLDNRATCNEGVITCQRKWEAGFKGPNGQCDVATCPGVPECGGPDQGTCDRATLTCQCTASFKGEDCSFPRCPGAPQECTISSGRPALIQGACADPMGICRCGPKFRGDDCSDRKCNGDDWTVDGWTECSLHGSCDSTIGNCTCDKGWRGDGANDDNNGCHRRKCPGEWGQEKYGWTTCSGHGSCDTDSWKSDPMEVNGIWPTVGQCTCQTNWEGDGCEYYCPEAYFDVYYKSVLLDGHWSGTCPIHPWWTMSYTNLDVRWVMHVTGDRPHWTRAFAECLGAERTYDGKAEDQKAIGFNGHSNQHFGGRYHDFAQWFKIGFVEPEGARWGFRYAVDAGYGIRTIFRRMRDGQEWTRSNVRSNSWQWREDYLDVFKGEWRFSIYASEGCCDGNAGPVYFRRNNEAWQTVNYNNIRSKCRAATWNKGQAIYDGIDTGYLNKQKQLQSN